jgi:hypothetical protein
MYSGQQSTAHEFFIPLCTYEAPPFLHCPWLPLAGMYDLIKNSDCSSGHHKNNSYDMEVV